MPLTGQRKLDYMRKRHAENRDRLNQNSAEYYAANKHKCIASQKLYAKAHPEVNKAAVKRYLSTKRKEPGYNSCQAAKAQAWRKANPKRHRANMRAFYKRKSETDLNFVIKNRLRARLTKKLKCQKAKKCTNTMALTACTGEFLRGYLEARFEKGMTWKTVHIDHHIPCAEFDLRDPEQQLQCFHYSNLKPMWGVDNISKGAKRPATHQAELI